MGFYKHILVGTDLSPEAEHHIEQALALAARHGARITLFHAIDHDLSHFQDMLPLKAEELAEMIRQETRRKIIELFGGSQLDELFQDVQIAFGKPHREMMAWGQQNNVDLLVVGPRHPLALKRLFLGSTPDKLLRHSTLPTLIMHPEQPAVFSRILAPVDLSAASRVALRYAMRLAHQEQAALSILHVCEETPLTSFADLLPAEDSERFLAVYEQQSRDDLANFLDSFDLDPTTQVEVQHGSPYQEIQRFVETHACDLIVMATTGRTGIEGFLLGNTAEKIARHLPCSLVTLKDNTSKE